MALPKRSRKLIEYLVFAYLIIFPFGQIIRFSINLLGLNFPLHPIDVISGIIFLVFLVGKIKQPAFYKSVAAFLASATFSLLLSTVVFQSIYILTGVLYLLRVAAHLSLIPITWHVFNTKSKKLTLYNSLFLVTIITAIFGWIQFLWLPDLRVLKYVGWDDHYYRLVGTFLDPPFVGIILVFGSLISFHKYILEKNKKFLLLMVAFAISLLVTYSRASYLSFIAGFSYLLIAAKRNIVKALIILAALFIVILPFLPRDFAEAAKLERTYSIVARFDNWEQTFAIFREKPLFGVGFNNICKARIKYLSLGDRESHACSGSDSSLLLVLATTGMVGFLIFINMIIKANKSVGLAPYSTTFKACGVALIVHSLFSNSLFYPWVMGWMGILLALSLANPKISK